jgi:hypothetical protein
MPKAAPVFISYSWDSAAHKAWVRNLALRLIKGGIDAVVDQLHLQPGESLTQFMEREISRCKYAIIVCTPQYATRSNRRRGGVGYEQQIISARIAAGAGRKKYIPLLKKGEFKRGKNCAILTHFEGILAIDVRTDYQLRKSFPLLLKSLGKQQGQPEHETTRRLRVMRLPNLELDGWQLGSGVVRSRLWPKTFHISPEHVRRNITKNQIVKLMFEISVKTEPEPIWERMWVRYKRTEGPYFVGSLANRPASYGEQRKLNYGDEIVFLPEHIIDFEELPRERR